MTQRLVPDVLLGPPASRTTEGGEAQREKERSLYGQKTRTSHEEVSKCVSFSENMAGLFRFMPITALLTKFF